MHAGGGHGQFCRAAKELKQLWHIAPYYGWSPSVLAQTLAHSRPCSRLDRCLEASFCCAANFKTFFVASHTVAVTGRGTAGPVHLGPTTAAAAILLQRQP